MKLPRAVRDLAVLLLLLCAMQACSSCASAGLKRGAYDTLSTTQAVLEATQRFEIGQVCGRAGAPPEGMCVPLDTHKAIQAEFLEAAQAGQEITAIVRSLPAGSPTPGNVLDLALRIKALAEHILSRLPKSPKAESLKAQLAGG